MDALTALHSRNSVSLLCEPGPSKEQLNNIIKAGIRACDHGWLRPWKYIVIEGDAREKFGQLLEKTKSSMDDKPLSEKESDKIRSKALRAPLIIAVVAKIVEHPKVPEVEQIMSAAASAQMMMTAAHAQGIGAIWRSGALMFEKTMHLGLNLDEKDSLVGFIYLGTPKATKPLSDLKANDFVTSRPSISSVILT